MIPAYGIHHDADIYADPEKFDPLRFTEENKKDRHPMAHIPFGKICKSLQEYFDDILNYYFNRRRPQELRGAPVRTDADQNWLDQPVDKFHFLARCKDHDSHDVHPQRTPSVPNQRHVA